MRFFSQETGGASGQTSALFELWLGFPDFVFAGGDGCGVNRHVSVVLR